jgi:hypothetical protein
VEHWIRSRFATLPASEVIGALYHVMREMTHAGRSSRMRETGKRSVQACTRMRTLRMAAAGLWPETTITAGPEPVPVFPLFQPHSDGLATISQKMAITERKAGQPNMNQARMQRW